MTYQLYPETPAQVGVIPRIIRLNTTDSFATVTTAGYISNTGELAVPLTSRDIVFCTYGTTPSVAILQPVITSGIITLTNISETGLSTTPGDFAVYSNATGGLEDLNYSPSNAAKTKVVMANSSVVSGNAASFSDTAGTVTDAGFASNKTLISSFASPDVNANIVRVDVTCGQAALASGGSVTLISSSGSKQYKILSIQMNSGGTNFSGGSGDRLGQVTDATTVYSVIPAASLQTLVNAQWGVTALPNPASAAINTSTAAGASLVFKYSGGTLDYTAGSVVISVTAIRVA